MSNRFSLDDYVPAGDGRITAVLGPTNTGKTHYALERMLAHKSGMIGLPLRLLAREIYDRIVKETGPGVVALVTGEEKIIPRSPRYWVATVEAMPLERETDFLAIDEVQLAADPERGRIFTSRILHARGKSETLFLGSAIMRPLFERLFPSIQFLSRDRLSQLTYTGAKKVTRLPRRTAIVGFSSDTVYAIAELIRRQRGGAAVVMGALSPRTRNAQAELYQSGEVDYLVATDAIGMGLNMDIDHVAFAASRKFDGRSMRNLHDAEIAQIAGRAGRHIRDGTFGYTSECTPFEDETVEAVENHKFNPPAALQWRTEVLYMNSPSALLSALDRAPPSPLFVRSRNERDEAALHRLLREEDVRHHANAGGAALATLWDICQTPDFRKLGLDQHGRLIGEIYLELMRNTRLDNDFMATRIDPLDRYHGDIDALSSRIAHIRSWTYMSNRAGWIDEPAYWQERTRAIEDKLSDALHEKLTQRFVDKRTATLRKRLKDNAPLLAGVNEDGEVIVEGQFIGRLIGFEFIVDPRASGNEAKSLRAAGVRALQPILAARAGALANADADELSLRSDGAIQWRSSVVARLTKGPAPLRPNVLITGLDQLTANMRPRVDDRIKAFVAAKIEGLLAPLINLQQLANSEDEAALQGIAKGVAYRLIENFGATSRSQFGDDLKQIDQKERAKMRGAGLRFGETTLFFPTLLKPAPAQLLLILWALWNERSLADTPPPKAGLVSLAMDDSLPHAYYYAAGYRPSGSRAVRIDMLERLSGLIRSARNEANMREGFEANAQMMSIVGCSGEDFEGIMRSLNFKKNVVTRKKNAQPPEAVKPSGAPGDNAEPKPETQSAPDASPVAEGNEIQAPTGENVSPTANVDIAEPPAPEVAADAATNEQSTSEGSDNAAKPVGTEGAEDEEMIEVALWRPAPRRPAQKPRNDQRGAKDNGRGDKQARSSNRPPKGKKGAKGGGKPDRSNKPNRQNAPMHAPRHRKTADPDSPFAVLADLKSQLSTNDGDGDNNKPETKKAG